MSNTNLNYKIKLPLFEGPFDLLLFFIERDELDIYNIPITKIINDFLDYIHQSEEDNIELSSEFILFVSTLMRIKAKMLLPRKEKDSEGNEIDPREEMTKRILEYKKFKEVSQKMAELESLRMLVANRGNAQKELSQIFESNSEGTELQSVTLFKLMKAFEKVMLRYANNKKFSHTVVPYNYTIEETREALLTKASVEKTLPFEKIFHQCESKIHAIFIFLSMLELIQQKFLKIAIGLSFNDFTITYNEPEQRLKEIEEENAPLPMNI